MATLPKNNIVRSVAPKSIFESAKNVISASVSYNQGDLIALTAGVLAPVTGDGDSGNILGVAKQTLVSGVVKSPYVGTAVDASQAIEDVAGPVYGVVASLILKTGDAFNPGDKVYVTTVNAQTVSSVDPGSGKAVGIYQGPVVASASAGQLGDVLVGAQFGMSSLSF